MSPRWMCQRSVTCAGDLPVPLGDADDGLVLEHLALGDRRPGLGGDAVLGTEGAQGLLREELGCTSIWLTAGVTWPRCARRRRWCAWKFETPMARARPVA